MHPSPSQHGRTFLEQKLQRTCWRDSTDDWWHVSSAHRFTEPCVPKGFCRNHLDPFGALRFLAVNGAKCQSSSVSRAFVSLRTHPLRAKDHEETSAQITTTPEMDRTGYVCRHSATYPSPCKQLSPKPLQKTSTTKATDLIGQTSTNLHNARTTRWTSKQPCDPLIMLDRQPRTMKPTRDDHLKKTFTTYGTHESNMQQHSPLGQTTRVNRHLAHNLLRPRDETRAQQAPHRDRQTTTPTHKLK
jgi:hypothetical protein